MRCWIAIAIAISALFWVNTLVDEATERTVLHFSKARRIAVVGNAPTILIRRPARAIDAADVVVRFNTYVLIPNVTGQATSLHAITAGRPMSLAALQSQREVLIVSNTPYHDVLSVFPHPFSFHLKNRGIRRLFDDDDFAGPSSGLATVVFLAAIAPRARVDTYGIGYIKNRTVAPSRLHYFNVNNGTLYDRMAWNIEGSLGVHHKDESGLLRVAADKFGNLNRDRAVCVVPQASNATFWRELRMDGYTVQRGVFGAAMLDVARDEIELRLGDVGPLGRLLHRFVNPTGVSTVDFLGRVAWYASRHGMHRSAAFVHTCFEEWSRQHFGTEVDIGVHNDITANHYTRWHKDRLNDHPVLGHFRQTYEERDPWMGDEYNIFKALVYLQDGPALEIVPGSHLVREIDPEGATTINITRGDVIVFDQRVTHRGHSNVSLAQRLIQSLHVGDSRLLISVSIAYTNSSHFPGFKQGTLARQDAIFRMTENGAIHVNSIFWLCVTIFVVHQLHRRLRNPSHAKIATSEGN